MINQLLVLSRQIGNELYGLLNDKLPNRIRGAMIGIDPLALQMFLFETGIYRYSPSLHEREWLHFFRGYEFKIADFEDFIREHYKHYRNGREFWNTQCKVMGYPEGSKPIYIRVVLSLQEDILRIGDLPKQFNGYPLVYEYRPPCITLGNTTALLGNIRANTEDLFGSRSDLSVGRTNPNTAGTLGGFLKDQNGKIYLVSCAHVLGFNTTEVYYPGPYEGRESNRIGQVTFADLPEALPMGIKYNSKTMPNAKKLDLAIAEITDIARVSPNNVMLPTIHTVRNTENMFLHDKVLFYGKTSGLAEAEICHLCIWYNVEINGQNHCFDDIFEIQRRRPWYVNTQFCKPGDSGSWILYQTEELTAWDGMLFAADDGAHGYCCFAEYILQHPTSQLTPII